MQFLYKDYNAWKNENDKYISNLLIKNSNIVARFKHIYDVLEFYSNKVLLDDELSSDESIVFSIGFQYLNEQITQIDILSHEYYKDDLDRLNGNAKTVNLLLYAYDFQTELNSQDLRSDELDSFIDDVLGYVKRNEEVPDEFFGILDDITFRTFKEGYEGIPEIFYDIAETLDIVDDVDEIYEVES